MVPRAMYHYHRELKKCWLLCLAVLGARYSQHHKAQSWRRACKRANIEGLTFHDLRHEATSRLADKLALHELMKVTGHKDMKMLARYYYHPRAEELAKKLG